MWKVLLREVAGLNRGCEPNRLEKIPGVDARIPPPEAGPGAKRLPCLHFKDKSAGLPF